jgi:peptidoglycan/LPS O-acetylase OafA/YrhL
MLIKVLLLIMTIIIGLVVAIPVKNVVDGIVAGVDTSTWGVVTVALVALIPIAFLVFGVFVNPARRMLRGEDPMGNKPRKKKPLQRF